MIVFIVIAILFLDQVSKFLVTKNLFLGQSIVVIKGIFHLSLVHNRGAAFGLLKNQVPLFVVTSIIAVFLIFLELKKRKQVLIYEVSLALVLAGALGNLIDRAIYGYVIDFLDFRIWPVFNIADSSISIGAVLLGLSILRQKK
ncbi:MAG: signal peptidase II [Candidatus Omnitrophica bacterium]|jgi:signal peptidase II|nr:signal peptidase II [Candidatus Omnitrophota bacterium]